MQSSLQTEEALTQGINKLHQTIALSMASDPAIEGGYECQMAAAVEKLEALESFVIQVAIYDISFSFSWKISRVVSSVNMRSFGW